MHQITENMLSQLLCYSINKEWEHSDLLFLIYNNFNIVDFKYLININTDKFFPGCNADVEAV